MERLPSTHQPIICRAHAVIGTGEGVRILGAKPGNVPVVRAIGRERHSLRNRIFESNSCSPQRYDRARNADYPAALLISREYAEAHRRKE